MEALEGTMWATAIAKDAVVVAALMEITLMLLPLPTMRVMVRQAST